MTIGYDDGARGLGRTLPQNFSRCGRCRIQNAIGMEDEAGRRSLGLIECGCLSGIFCR